MSLVVLIENYLVEAVKTIQLGKALKLDKVAEYTRFPSLQVYDKVNAANVIVKAGVLDTKYD